MQCSFHMKAHQRITVLFVRIIKMNAYFSPKMEMFCLCENWKSRDGTIMPVVCHSIKERSFEQKGGTCWWSFFDENIKTVFMAKHTHTLWWKATYLISRVSFLDNQNTRDIVNVKCTYVPVHLSALMTATNSNFFVAVSGCCHHETQKSNRMIE